MNQETQRLIGRLENTLTGEPWFGRCVYTILEKVNDKKAFDKPGSTEHSLIELLYHMITWAEFTLHRIEKNNSYDLVKAEELDWRPIDPRQHSWKKGLSEFKSINRKIISRLKKKNDDFLKEKVEYRKYNFHFLINGMIEHHIYHLGQIAYLGKWLS